MRKWNLPSGLYVPGTHSYYWLMTTFQLTILTKATTPATTEETRSRAECDALRSRPSDDGIVIPY